MRADERHDRSCTGTSCMSDRIENACSPVNIARCVGNVTRCVFAPAPAISACCWLQFNLYSNESATVWRWTSVWKNRCQTTSTTGCVPPWLVVPVLWSCQSLTRVRRVKYLPLLLDCWLYACSLPKRNWATVRLNRQVTLYTERESRDLQQLESRSKCAIKARVHLWWSQKTASRAAHANKPASMHAHQASGTHARMHHSCGTNTSTADADAHLNSRCLCPPTKPHHNMTTDSAKLSL